MARVAQFGIALGMLGVVLTLMGLFPGVTGIPPTPTIGIIQIVTVLLGYGLLVIGALVYVKFTFYAEQDDNLGQQVGVRLALSGLVFAAIFGLADVMGFGSNLRELGEELFLGPLQAGGLMGSFFIAALGVLIYALMGKAD